MKKLMVMALAVASTTAYAQSATDSVNVNVNPTDTLYIEVDEGTTGAIATIGAEDEDGNDNVSVTLSTSDFSVNPSSANITSADGDVGGLEPNVVLDYAVQDEYVFNTTITDAGGLSMTAVTKVKVRPNAITNITPDSVSVAENSLASSFTLSAERTLPNGNVQVMTSGVTYTILDVDGVAYNASTSPFAISGVNLQVDDNMDFEQQQFYAVNVRAQRGGQTYDDIVWVEVTNVNEAPFKVYVK